ncbi:hypothetical protein JWZ98_22835 (plasmid) [Methylomonas sp. EFPC1]|uniref:hypothetical protein n=1 Tax=Methylomonas sp. EFPC1 TaxID=2812647 RepID=UPI00196731C7|nr:hypothetical protein [Methylomonas sp. EFPC1]QSB03823.1 hypothetical protein JWZ98_22835 [Methylomonas sp. EFPC1]
MIRRIKLSRGDVLVVTDEHGNDILRAALTALVQYPDDNELLLDLCHHRFMSYNEGYGARRIIARLLDPDCED